MDKDTIKLSSKVLEKLHKRATMVEIRKWYKKSYAPLEEKLDIEDGQDVCDIIWAYERDRWIKTQLKDVLQQK